MRTNYNELKITILPKKGVEALIHELKNLILLIKNILEKIYQKAKLS